MSRTTWRKEIAKAAEGDSLIASTLSDAQLDKDFYDGYGGTDGAPFTAWSEAYVYFPVCYDGSEWVERVPRNPCDVPTEHVGG